MENAAIRKFREKNEGKYLEGVIEDKQTNSLQITSLRIRKPVGDDSLTFLVEVPSNLFIPAVALTKNDYVYFSTNKRDPQDAYDCTLLGIANSTSGRVYEI